MSAALVSYPSASYPSASYPSASYPSAFYPQLFPANVLPMLWAVGAELPILQPAEQPLRSVPPNISIYRRYTEAILRRFICMSMEAGKVPSLLGREMFRGKVTNYRVSGFDDVVIFVHDVNRCLSQIGEEHREIISRLALQQYTVGETAKLLGLHTSSVLRHYGVALDLLTQVFLDAGMLEALKSCQ
jgi:hypothetical protein